MLKTKRNKIFLVGLVIFSMVAMYGYMPSVNAASMDSAKDLIGDSHLGAETTHSFTINLATALAADDYLSIDFGSFTGAAEGNVTCTDANWDASTTPGSLVGCEATGAIASTSDTTITVSGVTNPATEGSYTVTLTTYDSSATEIESSQVKVYVLSEVSVTAHVDASLTFMLQGTTTAAVINGESPTLDSFASSSTLPFGDLTTTAKRIAQEVFVTTNATAGYTVTVQQDGDLENGAGATIDAFDDGTIATSTWNAPGATLGSYNTYGHMGFSTDDSGLPANEYIGLDGTTPYPVLSHTGPSDGAELGTGRGGIIYQIQVSALQEAGDYTSTLTYICTPTY